MEKELLRKFIFTKKQKQLRLNKLLYVNSTLPRYVDMHQDGLSERLAPSLQTNLQTGYQENLAFCQERRLVCNSLLIFFLQI